jgi:hypothetical protein
MSKCKPATKAELAWCEKLRKVLKAHPKSLWLFAGDGILNVMKYPPNRNEYRDDMPTRVEWDNSIASFNPSVIVADGGGW